MWSHLLGIIEVNYPSELTWELARHFSIKYPVVEDGTELNRSRGLVL